MSTTSTTTEQLQGTIDSRVSTVSSRSRRFWRAELNEAEATTTLEVVAEGVNATTIGAGPIAAQSDDQRNDIYKNTASAAGDDAVTTMSSSSVSSKLEKGQRLIEYVRENIIGDDETFKSPYGYRKMVYCDYVASGRSLRFIEQYIQSQVLPLYANTHTTNTITGLQSTMYRHEARQLIMDATNCSKKDRLVFCGSGATAALNKLVHMFAAPTTQQQRKLVVIVGPFEHHSNLLPWRECPQVERIVQIREDPRTGLMDLDHLEEELHKYGRNSGNNNDKASAEQRVLVGSFSAASNVTGLLTDTNKVTAMVHRHGGYAVWDYATAAPYVKIDMNPVIEGTERELVRKDAIFFSPHKFLGGVETPGVLIAKKHMFVNKVPENPGGGTVFFVTEKDHTYLKKQYEREEGGTPSIVGSIRCGMVFQLKRAIGDSLIEQIEHDYTTRALANLRQNRKVVILGNIDSPRLAIVSFLVRHGGNRFLHSNFVSALLNDLFGIQTRSGCMCAGPASLRLMGLNYETAKRFESELLADDDHEFIRPGFTRLNFHYTMDEDTFQYVLEAINFVANEGWKLLPQYTFYQETAEFVHVSNKKFTHRRWLHNISYESGKFEYRMPINERLTPKESAKELRKYMLEARTIVDNALVDKSMLVAQQENILRESAEQLRWFIYPGQALRELQSGKEETVASTTATDQCPIKPLVYESLPASVQQLVQAIASTDLGTENDTTPDITMHPESPKTLEQQQDTDGDQAAAEEEDDNPFSSFDAEFGITASVGGIPAHVSKKMQKGLWVRHISKKIMSPTGKAIKEFDMIREGDRILLGLSGGKDSLTMLHVLHELQQRSPVKFTFGACTVDPQTDSYNPEPFKKYLAELGVPYFFRSQNIIEDAKSCQASSICSWCSRMKRGILYNTCRREGYNVLILAQHMDDLAESFVMSLFHNGIMRTQKACYMNDAGDIRIIRPFIYVRERDIKQLAWESNLPIIAENCPACFSIPKERARIKTLLANQEHLFPDLYYSLTAAMKPLLTRDILNGDEEVTRKFKAAKPRAQPKWKTLYPSEMGSDGIPTHRPEDDTEADRKSVV